MERILVIDTGGTFNKIYNRTEGVLEVDKSSKALKEIREKWMFDFEIVSIIGKDSLDFNEQDRKTIKNTILSRCEFDKFIIVHGTDTMDLSAEFIDSPENGKAVVFTGAMVPYSIDPTEATANFAMSAGFLQSQDLEAGVYICMNGISKRHTLIKKNRKLGKFSLK